MKFKESIPVEGVITCISGLRIGGTKETVGIGETDNPIIRHPITRLPYIPGSSLKGKMRSLLEINFEQCKETTQRTGKPCSCGKCPICKMFGHISQQVAQEPGRLIFRDAKLTEEWENELKNALPGTYVETKTEIAMNRNSGTAERGALRQQERVPEGAEFDFELVIRLFDQDTPEKQKEYFKLLAEGFEMLENDYLGGCGTRGYGKVQITYYPPEQEEGIPMHRHFQDLADKIN